MNLWNRLVPAEVLRWGRLSSGPAEILDLCQRRTVLVNLGTATVRVTRGMCEDAGLDFDELKAQETR